ncbi:MAG: ribbon-helix-helix protein, CopG family [Salinibacterium sp.]|nr:MAG: ribbon-helix-helix protein, CopG family [Salinibacterium sp.]
MTGATDDEQLDEQQILAWAEEAERGYDVPTLKRRGRPRMGAAAAQVTTLRLEPELDAALTERADRDHSTRSEVMRDALRAWL